MTNQSASKDAEEGSRQSGSYELREEDFKFLQAVNIVLQKNESYGIKPTSANALSLMLSSDRKLIAQIKKSKRGVTKDQIKIFAKTFRLDIEWFYSEKTEFEYNPEDFIASVETVDSKGKSGSSNTTIKVKGKNANGGNVYSGEINGDITNHIMTAKKIINKVPPDVQKEVSKVFEDIEKKAEDIKKISDGYREQLVALKRQVETLMKSEREARESERLAKENELIAKNAELAAMREIIALKDEISKK